MKLATAGPTGAPRVLLVVPPAARLTIRDNFCSKVSQADYLNHPIDLVLLSGRLAQEFEIGLLDAMVERLGVEEALARVRAFAPRDVLILLGLASWDEDRAFLAGLRPLVPGRIVGLGDVLLGETAEALAQAPELDAALLDFTGPDLADYLAGRLSQVANMVLRPGRGARPETTPVRRPPDRLVSMPRPRHELFLDLPYRYPFVRRRPFATVMTEYGCPYGCTFCVMATLGVRRRPVSEVEEELRFLAGRGVREVFFIDQCFGSPTSDTGGVCRALAELGLGWLAFTRVDAVDPGRLAEWRRAGCHTLIFGVETADRGLLARYRKGCDPEKVRSTFRNCRRLGIRTVATFILGLPGDTVAGVERTIRFARSLDPDFASLNVAVPRLGTPLRRQALRDGLIEPGLVPMDQSGSRAVLETVALDRTAIRRLRRRFALAIYGRPGYLARRLAGIRSWDELALQATNGWALAREILAARRPAAGSRAAGGAGSEITGSPR